MTLNEVYQSKLSKYLKIQQAYLLEHKNEKTANPLLISNSAMEKFLEGDIRIMFFGQETNNWYNDYEPKTKVLQKAYDDFYTTEYCYQYSGQFWNGINRLKVLFEKEFPKNKITLIWNNIIKVGKQGKGRPNSEILEIERKYLHVIPDEVSILKPNVIVFFTGPNYDDIVESVFHISEIQHMNGFKERQLCKLIISDLFLSYRTYHPNYLWRNNINRYLKSIIRDIKKNINRFE